MTEAGRCPVVRFDHNSDEHSADPVESYRALREKAPVAWSEAHRRLLGAVQLPGGVRGGTT